MKSGKIKVDPKAKVTTIQSKEYVYKGQVKSVAAGSRRRLAASGQHLVSDGIGQQFGLFGIYEGEFTEGKITGYGRLIMPNQNVYVGDFVDGAFDGTGSLTVKGGDVIGGTWKNNQLVKTLKGKKASYKAEDIAIPKVMRVVPKEEKELLAIFDAEPIASAELISKWKEAKPFELENYINNGTLHLNKNLKI